MLKLKSCPKCKGDMIRDCDFDGSLYEHCLQCGQRHYDPPRLTVLDPAPKSSLRVTAKKRRKRSTRGAREEDNEYGSLGRDLHSSIGNLQNRNPIEVESMHCEGGIMKIRSIKSDNGKDSQFDLVTDDNGWLLLMNDGQLLACFDPKEYTLSALCRDMEMVLQMVPVCAPATIMA